MHVEIRSFPLTEVRGYVERTFAQVAKQKMLEFACFLVKMSCIEQCLCRNTPAQAARAAQSSILFLLDDRGLQTKLSRTYRGHIATGTGANDHNVKLFCHYK